MMNQTSPEMMVPQPPRRRKAKKMAVDVVGPSESMADEVQSLLNYRFRDSSLLDVALTHSSFPDHPSYERLEYVGDAALGLAFTNYFFLTNPDLGPGPLSVLRAANISTEKLARIAVRLGLYFFLRRNAPNLDLLVEKFTREVMKEEEEDCGEIPYGGCTVKAPKVLADIVESVAGAIYVDCDFNIEMFWKVFRGFLEPIITSDRLDEQPVTTLYELCQKHGMIINLLNMKKGDTNITNVFVDGKLVGIGSSGQKFIAKLNAARDALRNLPNYMTVNTELDSPVPVMEDEGSKQKLNDMCTKKRWPKPLYRIEKEQGPAHNKRFICSVQVETPTTFHTVSEGKSKVREAENSAAARMLSKIQSSC